MAQENHFSSQEFLQKLKERDHKSITILVNKYNQHLFNAAIGQHFSDDHAEEIVQATWAAFFDGLSRFEGKSHIRTYLFGILYNKMRETWRQNKRFIADKKAKNSDSETSSVEDIIESQSSQEGLWGQAPINPEKLAWISETGEAIHECLNNIGENYRKAFYLKEIEGKDSESICNIMNITRSNLGVLLFRAKNMLKNSLEKRYIDNGRF